MPQAVTPAGQNRSTAKRRTDVDLDGSYHPTLGKAAVTFAANDFGPEFAEGTAVGEWDTQFYYVPREGSRPFLKATITGRFAPGAEPVVMGLVNKAGNVAVVAMPPKDAPEAQVRPLSRLFRKLLESWKVDDRIHLAGQDDEWDQYAGLLTGDGYWLAAACNLSIDKPQKVSLRLKALPPGDYTVEDVTGDPPDLRKIADGGTRLKEDPANRAGRIDYTLSSQQLGEGAITADIAPLQAKVYLIRPAAQKVWVSIWKPSLRGFLSRPIWITIARRRRFCHARRTGTAKGKGRDRQREARWRRIVRDHRTHTRFRPEYRPQRSTPAA